MKRYTKGATFERKIIHDLLRGGFVFAMRGAGSKSYGSIKADIVAMDPAGGIYFIQAKNSKKVNKKEQERFVEMKDKFPQHSFVWTDVGISGKGHDYHYIFSHIKE